VPVSVALPAPFGGEALEPGAGYPPPPASEPIWPVQGTLLVAIVLQFTLPKRLTAGPIWLVPAFEGVLLIGLAIASPKELEREHTRRRALALGLVALASAANVFSLWELVHHLLHSKQVVHGRELIFAGMLVWLTNFLIFALWYWELDRGGPVRRLGSFAGYPDFLYPQMNAPDRAPRGWRPLFSDYLYVSLTNATAFSPTDTMPLSRWAKMLMLVQSMVSIVTVVLVAASLAGLALLARSGRLEAPGFSPAEMIVRLDGRFRSA